MCERKRKTWCSVESHSNDYVCTRASPCGTLFFGLTAEGTIDVVLIDDVCMVSVSLVVTDHENHL